MTHQILHTGLVEPGQLAERQHGVLTRGQLLHLGYSQDAIKHGIWSGRLHPVWRGVYAVGRPQLTRRGLWMAAVLSCGPQAVLSHESAAGLWGIRPERPAAIDVSVPASLARHRPGITVHRRSTLFPEDFTLLRGIRVTTPVCTLVDLASCLPRHQLEAAVNEADKHDLTDPETLRSALGQLGRRPGVASLRKTLDRRTFALTDSELERHFLGVARKAGLPRPETGVYVNGFKTDFRWPELGLVVETDGLRSASAAGLLA